MDSNEALSNLKPHNNLKSIYSYKKSKNSKKRSVGSFSMVVILILCLSNVLMYLFYRQVKVELDKSLGAINTVNSQNTELAQQKDNYYQQNVTIKQEFEKIQKQNSEIVKEIEALKAQNDELNNENKELSEDNVQLQNSLKMAASVGVKPQSYTKYDNMASRNEINRGSYIGSFLGTAYTPSKEECGNNKGITSSGEPIIPGVTIAIDTKYWPFGTVFYIKGLGYAVAMDSGGGIKGKYRFDFAVFDKKFARILGQRYWDVYLIKLGNGKVGNIEL